MGARRCQSAALLLANAGARGANGVCFFFFLQIRSRAVATTAARGQPDGGRGWCAGGAGRACRPRRARLPRGEHAAARCRAERRVVASGCSPPAGLPAGAAGGAAGGTGSTHDTLDANARAAAILAADPKAQAILARIEAVMRPKSAAAGQDQAPR